MFKGQMLANKYRVDRLLGVGGMGLVVAARHLQLDTMVAIKILLPTMSNNIEAVARFGQEARAVIQMNSAHVARIFDVGTLPTGEPYMVMELLDGSDLRVMLEQHGPVAVEEAVDLVLQTCEAVAEAHTLGIVHRDLKPANLFCILRPDGRRAIKVLDFGISKVTGPMWSRPEDPLTVATSVMGTPTYMSPEQLEAPLTVDFRTDIWSLGVILFELLTGRAPFEGGTLPQVSVRIAVRPALPLRALRPSIPAGLAAVIDTCLEKDRFKRFASVADLATSLLPFGSRRARISPERIIECREGETTEPPLPLPLPDMGLEPSTAPARRRTMLVPGLLVLSATLALGGLFLLHDSDNELSPTASEQRSADRGNSPSRGIDNETLARRSPTTQEQEEKASPTPAVYLSPEPARVPVPVPAAGGHRRRYASSKAGKAGKVELAAAAAPAGVEDATDAADLRGRSKPSCDPNYDLDDRGRKHFKPECFLNAKR